MNISGGGVKLNAKNSSFDYLAMQFRLHPRVAMSIGLLPFPMWDILYRKAMRLQKLHRIARKALLVREVYINCMLVRV